MRPVPQCFKRLQSQHLLPRLKMKSENNSIVFSPSEPFPAWAAVVPHCITRYLLLFYYKTQVLLSVIPYFLTHCLGNREIKERRSTYNINVALSSSYLNGKQLTEHFLILYKAPGLEGCVSIGSGMCLRFPSATWSTHTSLGVGRTYSGHFSSHSMYSAYFTMNKLRRSFPEQGLVAKSKSILACDG